MTDFSNLLSAKFDEIKRPPIKPAGTYHALITGYELGRSTQKKTPYVRFVFGGLQPGADIDPASCVDSDGTPIDFTRWKPTIDFYITPDALFRLKEFLESLQIPGTGREIKEMLPESRNLPVHLTVSVKPNEDGTGFFNRVEDVKAA